jgi:replicative DNA helicase
MQNEVEQNLIGCLLANQRVVVDVLSRVNVSDFENKAHQRIYKAIVDLFNRQEGVDAMTVATELGNDLKSVGGRTYLTDCVTYALTTYDYKSYVQIILEASRKRKILELLQSTLRRKEMTSDEIMQELSKLGNINNGVELENPIREWEQYKEVWREGAEKGMLGWDTGINSLNKLTYGVIPGHYWLGLGYRGYGKSYLGINLANQVLLQGGTSIIFSFEMTANEYIERLIGLRAGLFKFEILGKCPEKKLHDRIVAESDILKLIEDKKLIIYDKAMNSQQVHAKIVQNSINQKIGIVVVDYVQNVRIEGEQRQGLVDFSATLRNLAKDLNFAVLVLSQISNEVQKMGGKATTGGAKGAGELEADAHVILKILREADAETGKFTSDYTIKGEKVRYNEGGNCPCKIRFPGGKIEDAGRGETVNNLADFRTKKQREIDKTWDM